MKKNEFYDKKVLTGELKLESSDRNDIVQWIYDTHLVEWYTTYLLKQPLDAEDVEDKIQEIFVELCEIPQQRWNEIYLQGQYAVSAFVTGVIHQQIISVNSHIWKKYGKHHEKEVIMDENFWEDYYDEH